MLKAVTLVSMLVLMGTLTLQGVPASEHAGLNKTESAVEPVDLNKTKSDSEPPANATQFDTIEACQEAPEPGLCLALIPRYFYHFASKTCKVFHYGGCGGNLNNFETEAACLEKCHKAVEACSAARDPGPCQAVIPRYYYNSSKQKCESFNYGGCAGNKNNFKTKMECQATCSPDGHPLMAYWH